MPKLSQVTTGDRLPEAVVPITRSLIVAGAVATRDYQDVHHDTDAARRRGLRDVIMNIYTTQGLVSRYVTDWAGPDAFFRRVSLRLGVSNYPGDTMRLNGSVVARDGAGDVDVEVTGANSLGDHVVATVKVRLQGGADG